MNRRRFLATLPAAAATLSGAAQTSAQRPNVVLIMTDDQGWGDLGLHGNPHLKTPNIDRIAREGMQFTQFHVCPVCSPTRASLLTGRYNYRTGVVDTYLGRSMMRPEEVTLAEMLSAAGYRTGIFGKWHLGDNYPLRPGDQGFAESVVIKGGGLGQPSDFPDGGSYTNPILLRNGKPERASGYCTDVFFREAQAFIEANARRPFFAYIATNAPHTPLEIEDRYAAPFLQAGLDETTARVYGMVSNVDENVGRLLAKLDELRLADNTVLIFLTDNGPQQKRFNGGMRGLKGTVYEGGTRVPFFVRWPRTVRPGGSTDRLAAHIDVTPTLLEACGAKPQAQLDGRSLMPLLAQKADSWPDRTLFFQWHRGDQPEAFRASAARTQRWKLVDGRALYDLEKDPGESTDVADAHPQIVAKLRGEYEKWFAGVSSRGYAPPDIAIGAKQENPVVLTRQDWRGPRAGWDAKSLGYWQVRVMQSAEYAFEVRATPSPNPRIVRVRVNGVSLQNELAANAPVAMVGRMRIPAGPGRLEAELVDAGSEQTTGVQFVTVRKIR